MLNYIPVNQPIVWKEAKENGLNALESGCPPPVGPYVEKFEKAFATHLNCKHAITVNTGTAALHISLLASGIQPGDEIIVPAFTMSSTWLAVLYVGAIPVFVDCEPETYNINVPLIEEKISSRTRAIIPVHIYGHPCDMAPLMKMAQKHQLIVIEDAAEAHGSQYKGLKCGSIGDINCFSFYANKLITTGEGGMVVTNNDLYATEARKLKDLYHSDDKRFVHEKIGFNYRMTNLQAAVGLGELSHLDEYIAKKQQMANTYHRLLRAIDGLRLPITRSYAINSFWMYSITIDENKFGMDKDSLRRKLKEIGIETRDFFYPPTQQPIVTKFLIPQERFPVAEKISSTGLYLPSGLAIDEKQICTVCKAIRQFSSNHP